MSGAPDISYVRSQLSKSLIYKYSLSLSFSSQGSLRPEHAGVARAAEWTLSLRALPIGRVLAGREAQTPRRRWRRVRKAVSKWMGWLRPEVSATETFGLTPWLRSGLTLAVIWHNHGGHTPMHLMCRAR